jgi:outer membrane receptor protein involved in Fe transport
MDVHNLFGLLHAPRIHVRYTPQAWLTLRASAGQGYRVKNLLAEHLPAMMSARLWQVPYHNNKAFGFNPEQAWTYSASALGDLQLWGMRHDVMVELYHTRFQHQVVADFDVSAQGLTFYSANGASFAQSVMISWNTDVNQWLDIKLAWKTQDVKTTFNSGLREMPFVARNKWYGSVSTTSWKGWEWNATGVITGTKRLPDTQINPENLRFPERSPSFFTFNMQLTKNLSKQGQVYVGVENLTDFRQKNLIIDPDNPTGQFFDASLVWGPVIGRMTYAGFRWKWN